MVTARVKNKHGSLHKANLRDIDIANPMKDEARYVLNLLSSEEKRNGGTYAATQEYHPDGGQRKRIRPMEFVKRQYNQRQSAPFVLCYFTREHYEKILEGYA